MIVLVIDVIAAFLLCLYLANGKMTLFHKDAEFPIKESEDEPKMSKLSLKQRFEILKKSPRLWIFGMAVAAVGFGFYVFRQTQLVNAPLLNMKYLLLLYVFCAAAVVDLHYSIIPNNIVLTGLAFWIVLAVFTVTVEQSSVIALAAYSGLGILFGGGVLWLCRILMKGSMGFGDIKFMGVTGLICGFYKTFNILFYSLVFAFIAGVILLLTKKRDRRATIPLAPFLLMGYLAAGFIGI